MSIDLTAAPFSLDAEAIEWVHRTREQMSAEEKVGQLFVAHGELDDDTVHLVDRLQLGGVRLVAGAARAVSETVDRLRAVSTIAPLVAANLETGGEGAATDGTAVAAPLQCVATGDLESARTLGEICAREGTAVGCNWSFSPVADIHMNWRNAVASTRAFGADADTVLQYSTAYIEGAARAREFGPMAFTAKHFPGDGVDDRDQHIVTSINSLDAEEWRSTFGRVYRGLIDAGIASIMIGHIALPSLTRELAGDDAQILPATLAPELLNDLLREELGFNGLTVTDALHMVGFTSQGERADLLVRTVNAGCDMLLFVRDPDADVSAIRDAVVDGRISAARLDEAVTRILGLKASLGLHRAHALTPERREQRLGAVGHPDHQARARDIAERSATLVIDKGVLPLNPATHPRVRLITTSGLPIDPSHLPITTMMRDALEQAGFTVSGPTATARVTSISEYIRIMAEGNLAVEGTFDAAVIVAHYPGIGNQAVQRLQWQNALGPAAPWWAGQVPTVFISYGLPNHLSDVPMVGAYINAYHPSQATADATVERLLGNAPFTGIANVNAMCGLTVVI